MPTLATLLTAACGDEIAPSNFALVDSWSEVDLAFGDDDEPDTVWLASAADMLNSASPLPDAYSPRRVAWSPCGDELALRPRDVPPPEPLLGVSQDVTRTLAPQFTGDLYTAGEYGHWWAPGGDHIAVLGAARVDVGVLPSCGYGDGLFLCDVAATSCRGSKGAEFSGVPSWSPAGDRVVTVRRYRSCTVEPADGETVGPWLVVTHTTDGALDSSMPAIAGQLKHASWSPKDERIVVAAENGDGVTLLTWRPDTDAVETVVARMALTTDVLWFPDGERWLVTTASEPPALATLDARTGEQLEVLPGFSGPLLAPDGVRVLARKHSTGRLVILNLMTGATVLAAGDRHWWRPTCDAR
jgi:dipeptidyl aminopeptidase/acylaminoacyl peptidase